MDWGIWGTEEIKEYVDVQHIPSIPAIQNMVTCN